MELSMFLAAIGKTIQSVFRFRVKAGHGQRQQQGRRDDADNGSVGAGMTVPLKPPPPALVGKEAKPIPTGYDNDGSLPQTKGNSMENADALIAELESEYDISKGATLYFETYRRMPQG